ncbi:unnamed protein product, partial [Strongylus vulgaris]
MFYEVILGDEGPAVVPHDFGVMEAWHVKIAKSKTNYITCKCSLSSLAPRIRALAFLPNDDEILTGSDDKTIKLHSIAGERPRVERIYCGHRSSVLSLAVDDRADGSRF